MDTRNVFLILAIVALLGFSMYTLAKSRGALSKKRGVHVYEAPGKTAAECRRLLGQRTEQDLFAYKLEAAPAGGWHLTFSRHTATDQILDTMYLLQFEGERPARIALKFEREAFGQREAVIPGELLDAFMLAKLGAHPVPPE